MESTQVQQLEAANASEHLLRAVDLQKAKSYIEDAVKEAKNLQKRNSTEPQTISIDFDDRDDGNEDYVTQFCKYIQESFRTKKLEHLVPYIKVNRKAHGYFFFSTKESFLVEISTVKCY